MAVTKGEVLEKVLSMTHEYGSMFSLETALVGEVKRLQGIAIGSDTVNALIELMIWGLEQIPVSRKMGMSLGNGYVRPEIKRHEEKILAAGLDGFPAPYLTHNEHDGIFFANPIYYALPQENEDQQRRFQAAYERVLSPED